jgi:uncharacterized membrane protein YebE (DUF533 family)
LEQGIKMLAEKILQIMLLAAFSDGEVQQSELALLNSLRTHNKLFKSISDRQIQNVIQRISIRLSGDESEEKSVFSMLVEIAKGLNGEEKNIAYALSAEMCASNFRILPAENEFLKKIIQALEISPEQADIVHRSIELRYGKIAV